MPAKHEEGIDDHRDRRTLPSASLLAPGPKDLALQLPDSLFRAYFVRAIDEAVADPVDRTVLLARYALLGPTRGNRPRASNEPTAIA